MMRRIVAVVIVAVWSVAALSADLRYTMTTTARPASGAPREPSNPVFGLLGTLFVGMMAPGGAVEMRAIVSERAARFEFDKPYALVPAGGALILMANGDMVVLNPAEKSYWKMSRPDSTMVPGMAPAVKVERTSTVETILGVRTERAVIDIRVPVPVSPGMAMPGMPTEVAITGEAWLADEYSKYATSASSLGALVGTTGGGSLANLGFPMRSVLRGDVFAGQEIESVVTSISETPAPDGAFDIPAGFTEMPPPRIGLPSLGSGR